MWMDIMIHSHPLFLWKSLENNQRKYRSVNTVTDKTFSNLYLPHFYFKIQRKTIDNDELHRMVYDFLKQQTNHRAVLVKCTSSDPISDFVEEITISQPNWVIINFSTTKRGNRKI